MRHSARLAPRQEPLTVPKTRGLTPLLGNFKDATGLQIEQYNAYVAAAERLWRRRFWILFVLSALMAALNLGGLLFIAYKLGIF